VRGAPDTVAAARHEAETVPLDELDVSRVDRFQADTHWPFFARLRREAPVHHCRQSAHGPYWSITRLDDVLAIETNPRQFSSHGNVIIGDVPEMFQRTWAFATADPPVHTRERGAVRPAMAPARAAALEAGTRAHVAAVLDGLPRDRPFDWVERVAVELTNEMVATLFDLPGAARRRLPYWSDVLLGTPGAGAVTVGAAAREAILEEFRATVIDVWRRRAAAPPGDDVLSALAHHPDTAAMVDDPWHLVGTVTLVAGANEASRGALAGAVVALDQFPGEWEKLRARPALIPTAAAEIVRWQTPIAHMRRTATEDVELRGRHVRKGDRVVLWYCSANRDETVFDEADVLRIDRVNARRHVAFGAGIHRCLGSHLAEMQLRVLLEEMLARFPRVELAAEPRRKASNFSASYDEVLARIPS
jgi:cytochrome P450